MTSKYKELIFVGGLHLFAWVVALGAILFVGGDLLASIRASLSILVTVAMLVVFISTREKMLAGRPPVLGVLCCVDSRTGSNSYCIHARSLWSWVK